MAYDSGKTNDPNSLMYRPEDPNVQDPAQFGGSIAAARQATDYYHDAAAGAHLGYTPLPNYGMANAASSGAVDAAGNLIGSTLGGVQAGVAGSTRQLGAQIGDAQQNFAQQMGGFHGIQQGDQATALGLLRAGAQGQGPTAADVQLQRGLSGALQSQLTAAASARGGAAQQAAAQQQAAGNAPQLQAQVAGQAAQLRAQEQQQAQRDYLSGGVSIGGQQLQAAQVTGAQGLNAAQIRSQQELAGVGLAGQAGLHGAGMIGSQGLALGGQLQGEATTTAQLQAQQSALNQQQQQFFEGKAFDVSRAQQNAGIPGQTLAQQQGQFDTQQNQNWLMGLVGGGVGLASVFSDITNKESIAPQGDAAAFARDRELQAQRRAQLAPATRASSGPPGALREQARAALEPNADAAAAIRDRALVAQRDAQMATLARLPQGLTKKQALALLMGGPAAAPVAPAPPVAPPQGPPMAPPMQVPSDERGKARPGHDDVADAYLERLSGSASTYSYRNPHDQPVSVPRDPGARFGGVMAQDLERVPEIGRQLVTDTPGGKVLEGGSNLSAALMGLGRLAERVRQLERRR